MQEKIKDKKTPNKFNKETEKLFSVINFCKLNKLAAPKVGIDSKKEILAESTLLKLKYLAPLIVIPDLLAPGINDKT